MSGESGVAAVAGVVVATASVAVAVEAAGCGVGSSPFIARSNSSTASTPRLAVRTTSEMMAARLASRARLPGVASPFPLPDRRVAIRP